MPITVSTGTAGTIKYANLSSNQTISSINIFNNSLINWFTANRTFLINFSSLSGRIEVHGLDIRYIPESNFTANAYTRASSN